MGTGFTTDTPLNVARFGIASVISLADDVLIERLRRYHAGRTGEPYEVITEAHPDPRAARITAYLNLVHRLVTRQVAELRAAPFEAGSEIERYFELLPAGPLREQYQTMVQTVEVTEKARLQARLRQAVRAGSIDVNIMTKMDCARYRDGVQLPPEYNDAVSGLRGFANSTLESAVVFSAGLNQRLYTYASEIPGFLPGPDGRLKKRIILKVSDYRSAAIQGRFLAKRGLWVSEFRVESGLNCGGHAFASGGQLLGPILEEFKQKRAELAELLWTTCVGVWQTKGVTLPAAPYTLRLTVQGGLGTAGEQNMLRRYYGVDSTGWGSPFLLASDVTAVDESLIQRLLTCQPGDIYMSDSSPLGVPFWNLRQSPSEAARERRAADGYPGSPCPKGYAKFDHSFGGTPVCLASHDYQQQRLAQLKEQSPAPAPAQIEQVIVKSCICHELGGSALLKYGLSTTITPAICPGPNLIWFRQRLNLDTLIHHIYGRHSVVDEAARPHMFIQELGINIEYLKKRLAPDAGAQKSFHEFTETLRGGIQYYRERLAQLVQEGADKFHQQLDSLAAELAALQPAPA